MSLEPESLQFLMIVRTECMTLKNPVQFLEMAPMEGDNRLSFQHTLVTVQPSARWQGPQEPAKPLHRACLLENLDRRHHRLTNAGDLFLRKSEAGKLSIATATTAGRAGRTVLGAITRWSRSRTVGSCFDGSGTMSRERCRCPLWAVITGRAQNICTTRRRSHCTSVSGGSSVGHHRIISGAHGDPLYTVPSTLHRGPLFFRALRFTHYFLILLSFSLPRDRIILFVKHLL